MGNIVLLDELTINKIAAGEVIERPASVIKEMVENSIDAGADKIAVEIKNGGISYIRIIDNGKGILPDDMELAFERHATSKIRSATDLETVKSMGFRGEALASIAAISNVEIISKTKDQDVGMMITVQAGKLIQKEEVASQVGTTITVKNLFFNTPVRYKFLKKDYTESGYIEDIITRLSLVNPNISFKLLNENKTIVQTSGNGSIKEVIYNIYGKDIANGVLDVDYNYEDIHIKGVIGKPEIARSNRSNQLFFVNERYIKDKTLSSATEQAFKGMLPIGKYAFLVLNVKLPQNKVDVNVHPAKLEVRFEEESKIFKAIYHSIKETLLKGDLVSKENVSIPNKNDDTNIIFEQESNVIEQIYNMKVSKEEVVEQESKEQPNNGIEETKIDTNQMLTQGIRDLKQMKENLQKDVDNTINMKEVIQAVKKEAAQDMGFKEKVEKLDNNILQSDSGNFEEMYAKTFGISYQKEENKQEVFQSSQMLKEDNISVFETKEEYILKPNYKFVGIAFSTYIIIEMENDLYMIDQHAAHERIMYEKIKRNYYEQDKRDSQLLLLPDIITLTHKEMDILKENMDVFEKAGFSLEEFGENTIKLTGAPNVCIDLDTKELFLETLDEINTVARTAKQEIEEKFIATVACKAAVKANMNLSKQEVDKLMESLLVLPNPFTCPHGRPTAIKLNKNDFEKKFSRRK